MSHVTATVTKMRFVVGSHIASDVTIIFTKGYLQIFKTGYFFSQKYWPLTKPQIMTNFPSKLVSVT